MKEVKTEITGRDELIRRNVLALGYPKDSRITYGGAAYERVEVFANGEYIGIWDDVKQTFVD